MEKDKQYSRDEIRKEFQLERMVLFSDAVFAIVITLMAIEIRVPELERNSSPDLVIHEIVKLIPMVIAYAVSFFFIGHTWYQHLQLFSLLKDYDKGLVVRNLIMLFFIGLFPFSVALMVKIGNNLAITWIVYFSVILFSKSAQLFLQHYILYKRPNLRINTSIHEDTIKFRKSRMAIMMLVICFILILITNAFITDPEYKPLVWYWVLPLPVLLRIMRKKIK
jgi:uncharacterized membrane protein